MSSFYKGKSYSHFFSKNISVFATFNDQCFNNMLTNDIVSFQHLGPELAVLPLFEPQHEKMYLWTDVHRKELDMP